MAELFGFTIQRSSKDTGGEKTFSTPTPDDGTIDVAGGGFFGQILDTDGRERSDLDLIRRYRDIAQQAECDTAIEDIVNEGNVSNQNDQAVEISLDRLRYPDKIKRKIRAEFDEVLRLLNFERKGHDIFRSAWPTSITEIALTNEAAGELETFDVTWRYQHFEASGVNF